MNKRITGFVILWLIFNIFVWQVKVFAGDFVYGIYGHGATSCGLWVQDRREKNSYGSFSNTAWVLGYISATGYYIELKKTDLAAIEYWLDKYCAAHPLKRIKDATDSLIMEL